MLNILNDTRAYKVGRYLCLVSNLQIFQTKHTEKSINVYIHIPKKARKYTNNNTKKEIFLKQILK